MTDTPKVPDMTPEEEAAFVARLDAFFGEVLPKRLEVAADAVLKGDPTFHLRLYSDILRGGLESLRHYIEDPAEESVSWENPWTELHYPVEWDWERGGLVHIHPETIPEPVMDAIVDALRKGEDPLTVAKDAVVQLGTVMLSAPWPVLILQGLTNMVAVHVKGGQVAGYFFLDEKVKETLDAFPKEERPARMAALLRPSSIGALEVNGDTVVPLRSPWEETTPIIVNRPEDLEAHPVPDWTEIHEEAKSLPMLTLKGEVNGTPFEGSVVLMIHPLVVDEDKREAYFPIVVGLAFAPTGATGEPRVHTWSGDAAPEGVPEETPQEVLDALDVSFPDPSTWPEKDREDLWKLLLEDLPKRFLESIEKAETGAEDHEPEPAAVPVEPGPAVVTGSITPSTALVPAGAPPPERRASVMSPYPLPRTLAKDAQAVSLRRGLGRMFGSAAKIPDLDFRGETALVEAEALFWPVLEDFLDKALSPRTPPASWKRENLANGKTVILLSGVQVDEARTLWAAALRAMNATEGGPGLEVVEPAITSDNRWDQETKKALVRTRIVLWPEDSLRTREGDPVPPVQFRLETSPGYLNLLARQGPRPFFADGWLWLPRGNEREGFRIAGLPRLLFPEGRKALERLARKSQGDQEAELNRLLRNPTLFRDEDSKVVRELQSALSRTEAWIKDLSLYDTRDLTLCLFEAWYRQREAWFREEVKLEDGREVSTKPYRIIRLDPEDLRIRLDPRAASGANWRARLFKRLEALTTFERQTRDRKGRKVDVGDRLVERVIDGYRGVEEASAPDQDAGLGLTRKLKASGGIPSRSFFAVVSVDFMERLVTWAVDEGGAVRWGLEAAKAAERAALVIAPERPREARNRAEETRKKAKARPYYDGSPRLMSLSNLEDWPPEVKDMAHVLLQEVTRKKGEKTLEGRVFIACAGSYGKGYKVQAWLTKWGPHLLRTGPRGGVQALTAFLDALRFLSSHDPLSVQVELRPPRRRGESAFRRSKWNEDALDLLDSYRNNPPAVYDLKLIPYLPEDLEDRLRGRLQEDGIEGLDEDEAAVSVLTPPVQGGLSPSDIRGARKRAGWEQSELAAKVGVARVMVSLWENAKRPVPKERMDRLREVLEPYLDPADGVSGVASHSPEDPSA